MSQVVTSPPDDDEISSEPAESRPVHSELTATVEPRKKRQKVQEDAGRSSLPQPSASVCRLLVCRLRTAFLNSPPTPQGDREAITGGATSK